MTTSTLVGRWPRTACGLLLATASAAPAWAQDTATLDANTAITSEAQAVLDRMTATLKSLQSFEVTAHATRDEVLPFGYKLQNHESARMLVERPNRMRVEVQGDIKNRTYVYDGTQLSMYAPDFNVYSATPAPGTLGELASVLLDAGVELPLIDMLYHGATGKLTEDVRVGIVVGDTMVDGVQTDHLAFRQPQVDWQLWVEKGKQALPRKLLITTRYSVGDPQYQATLHWNLKPEIEAKSFTFVPPSGATKIASRNRLVATGGEQ